MRKTSKKFRRGERKMPITIFLNDKDLDKYPSLHSSMIEELEDDLAKLLNKTFVDFIIVNSYTGNTIRDVPKKEGSK